jgi:two-component system response regulator
MPSPFSVLLVEDDPTQVAMTKRAVKNSELRCSIQVATDGEEACDFLFKDSQTRPDLVILDLHLPKICGFDVLSRIRATDRTRYVPVVVMSSTDDMREVRRCAELHANSFVKKSFNDRETFDSAVRLMLYYWLALHLQC